MLISILTGSGTFAEKILDLVMIAVIVLISLTVHEVAHGWIAYKMGDPTAKNLGRLSLNPIKHLDPIGAIMMLLIGIGYAKPVPVNSRYFKNPKRGMALTASAGPAANFIMAFFAALLYLVFVTFWFNAIVSGAGQFTINVFNVLFSFFLFFCVLNLSLGIFNLLPIPPFDGSRIFYVFLPEKWYFAVMKYERYILLAVILLLFVLPRLGIMNSSPITAVSGFFTKLFVRFWSMIPIFDGSSGTAMMILEQSFG